MPHIVIISSSVREGRNSHRVAKYFKRFVEEKQMGSAEILDLKRYNFPLFEERLKHQESPSAEVLDFATRIKNADGVIIVTPEYNGGYPASIKNAIDLLYSEWHRKPVAISTVSDGVFGGSQVIISLQFIMWKMKAWTVPAMFPVPSVLESFDEEGRPYNNQATRERASKFINEILWCIEAKNRMK